MTKLLPCPFCGSDDIDLPSPLKSGYYAQLTTACKKCRASLCAISPKGPTWNERAVNVYVASDLHAKILVSLGVVPKPCPFCGRRVVNIPISYHLNWERPLYLICMNCRAQGPLGKNLANALFKWNKRVEIQDLSDPH